MGKQSRRKREAREERAQGGTSGGTRKTAGGRNVPNAAFAEKSKFPVFWVVVGLIFLAAFIAAATLGGETKTPEASAYLAVSKSIVNKGADLPDFPASENASESDPAKGKTIPAVTGDTPKKNGSRLTIGPDSADGKPQVIFFMAHWCPHCNAEVPRLLKDWKTNGEPKGVAMFTIATANDEDQPNFPAGKWMASEGWKVPTILDDENDLAADVFGVQGYPFFIFVNADGTVNHRASGELEIDEFNKQIAAIRKSAPAADEPAKAAPAEDK